MLIKDREQAYDRYKGYEWYDKHQHIEYPEGFRERLLGKTIEAQMKCFAVVENTEVSRSSYGETDSSRAYRRAKRLPDLYEFRGLIVEDSIIEGIIVQGAWGRDIPMGPYDTVCTYYASDDNGSGSKDREDTVTLICLPPDREWD